jgi:hypothetical protein
MPILDSADVAPEQARSFFNVALREFLFFSKFAESVADDHAGIIPLGRLEGKQGPAASDGRKGATGLAAPFLDPLLLCGREEGWALRDRVLDRLLLSRNSRFLRKLCTLTQIVAVSCADFRRATIDLTLSRGVGSAGKLWAVMDGAEYDLNTCLRELLVMLKCFLRVLPAEELAMFEATSLRLTASRRASVFLTDWAFHPSAQLSQLEPKLRMQRRSVILLQIRSSNECGLCANSWLA